MEQTGPAGNNALGGEDVQAKTSLRANDTRRCPATFKENKSNEEKPDSKDE